ncbi:hypothetical protein [Amycolatopsis sp. 195334CR]|uniref:hypothetical protein n=1 Tax=Amycolatopsis sp. 195334CR TaxID=2814588 RepID=UPI001A8C9BC4|nr:hypothetical protein [Amycolatopsis sp. 195334CR]MBN6034188.1 hypothetical protein [Amycolatopsis sp. 195334CR]
MVIQTGLAGTHATGKSLLADRIEMELRSTGISVQRTGGLAKRAAALGFPKMNRHTATSTEWIITAGAAIVLEAELDADVVLIDRTAHDALAYYTAALALRGEHPEPDDLTRLQTLASLHTHRLHVLLATVLDPDAPFTAPPGKTPPTPTPSSGHWSTSTCTSTWPTPTSNTGRSPGPATARPSPPPWPP